MTALDKFVFSLILTFFIRLDRKILCGVLYDFYGDYAAKLSCRVTDPGKDSFHKIQQEEEQEESEDLSEEPEFDMTM